MNELLINYLSQTKTVVVFAMGATQNASVQRSIELESQTYGDIIQEDFVDSYKNLTHKVCQIMMNKYKYKCRV
jgi:hypothetical protein